MISVKKIRPESLEALKLAILKKKPLVWENYRKKTAEDALAVSGFSLEELQRAHQQMLDFGPVLLKYFPGTEQFGARIESLLHPIERWQSAVEIQVNAKDRPLLLLKRDDQLMAAGSIKARGGFYEVLCHGASLARRAGFIDPYALMTDEKKCQAFFSKHRILVGSTGNLGLSIGIVGKRLGFSVEVHMSKEAAKWKKDLLRTQEVTVIEHAGDYQIAVDTARKKAHKDEYSYFIDDQHSRLLFLGYASAAFYLQQQLLKLGVVVSKDKPLHVYLPCGVGGGPGGISLGLKYIYGDLVHCHYVEPVGAPSMLLALASQRYDEISLEDIGLKLVTLADGLAVGRASGLVCQATKHLIDSCITVDDKDLLRLVYRLYKEEKALIETSAAASLYGYLVNQTQAGTHIAWSTGGGLMPAEVKKNLLTQAKDVFYAC